MYSKSSLCRYAFCLIVFMIYSIGDASEIVYPDFKESMLRANKNSKEYRERQKLYNSCNRYYLNIFEYIYKQNILEVQRSDPGECYRIPRIIHQICFGSEIPEKFSKWMQTWSQLKGWEYKLWTDKEIKCLKLYNQDLYNNSKNNKEKSDIARLEILSLYGGIYVDMDYECLRPELFEELHRNFDFYIGFEPIEYGKVYRFNMFKVCNSVIGSVPYNPLIQDMIVNLKASYLAYKSCGVMERTGPAFYTRIICEYAAAEYALGGPVIFRTMYLPSTFLYNFTKEEIMENNRFSLQLKVLPETAGIHYWDESY